MGKVVVSLRKLLINNNEVLASFYHLNTLKFLIPDYTIWSILNVQNYILSLSTNHTLQLWPLPTGQLLSYNGTDRIIETIVSQTFTILNMKLFCTLFFKCQLQVNICNTQETRCSLITMPSPHWMNIKYSHEVLPGPVSVIHHGLIGQKYACSLELFTAWNIAFSLSSFPF